MRHWVVGGAVIESGLVGPDDPARVLLVENIRGNGTSDWTPPGGVIDHGESVTAGLSREVLRKPGSTSPVGRAALPDRGRGTRAGVDAQGGGAPRRGISGQLNVGADPDGIVVGARVGRSDRVRGPAGRRPPWVREPLLEWLDSGGSDPGCSATGSKVTSSVISRSSGAEPGPWPTVGSPGDPE